MFLFSCITVLKNFNTTNFLKQKGLFSTTNKHTQKTMIATINSNNINKNSQETMTTASTTADTSNTSNKKTVVVPTGTTTAANKKFLPPPPPLRPRKSTTTKSVGGGRAQYYHRSANHNHGGGGGGGGAAAAAATTTLTKSGGGGGRAQFYQRSAYPSRGPYGLGGYGSAAAAATKATTILEKIKEEPSSRLLDESEDMSREHVAFKEEGTTTTTTTSSNNNEAVVILPEPEQKLPPQKQQQQGQPTSSRMESFMLLGDEYQYKLLAINNTTTGINSTTKTCFVPFSTIGSTGLLASLQGQPPFVVLTDDDDNADSRSHPGNDANSKFCIMGVVEQHPSYPDDESNDSSDFNDDGDESMFWMATLNNKNNTNQSSSVMSSPARVIHLRSSEMIRFIRKMQYEDLSSMLPKTKRHFLVYSRNEKGFVLKNSNDIVKSIQESMMTAVVPSSCSQLEEEEGEEEEKATAAEHVKKEVVELTETKTETVPVSALAANEETEDLDDDDDDDDDDDTTQEDAVNASLDVLVPSDMMKPHVARKSTVSSSTTNTKDEKNSSGRSRRHRPIKIKWFRLMKGLLCLRQRRGHWESGYSSGSRITGVDAMAPAATLSATREDITPAPSSSLSSSSSTNILDV
jgi:hypothetical protein